jgi:hypothetical protein
MEGFPERMQSGEVDLIEFPAKSGGGLIAYEVLPHLEIETLAQMVTEYASVERINIPTPFVYLIKIAGHQLLMRFVSKDVTGTDSGKGLYFTYIESMCVALVPADMNIGINQYVYVKSQDDPVEIITKIEGTGWDLPRVEIKTCPEPIGDIVACVISGLTYFDET